ncbi:hypothetical protein LINPERPRIM_LOCUS12995 [Linum perenne]
MSAHDEDDSSSCDEESGPTHVDGVIDNGNGAPQVSAKILGHWLLPIIGGEPPEYCCETGEVGHKLEKLISSLNNYGSWELEEKDLREASLQSKITRLLKALRQRGDWDFENIEELNLGASAVAKETKIQLLELVDKKDASESCSDYESDPETEF